MEKIELEDLINPADLAVDDISNPLGHELRRDMVATVNLLLPFITVAFVGLYFSEFIIHAIIMNKAINLGIMFTAVYGVMLIVSRFVSVRRDFNTIERFGYEASLGKPMKELLKAPWVGRRYVRHFLGHVANTGGSLTSQIDQQAIENELHALAEDYESKMEMPQFLVGFMIALGLLGTFIGLLETLTGISGMLDSIGGGGDVESQFMQLVGELKKPLAGMGIAFSASMFGLVGSLMLAIMMTTLRRYTSRTIACARNVTHEQVQVGSRNESPLTSQIAGAGGSMPIAVQNLNILLAGRIEMLTKKLDTVVQGFEASIASTQKQNDLLGFGPRMKEISEKTLDEMKLVLQSQNEQNFFTQKLIESNMGLHNTMKDSIDLLERVESSNSRGATQIVRVIETSTEKTQDASRLTLETWKAGQIETTKSIKELAERLTDVKEVSIGSARHLWEIKEIFVKLSKSLDVMEVIASSVSGQALATESLLQEIKVMNHLLQGGKVES